MESGLGCGGLVGEGVWVWVRGRGRGVGRGRGRGVERMVEWFVGCWVELERMVEWWVGCSWVRWEVERWEAERWEELELERWEARGSQVFRAIVAPRRKGRVRRVRRAGGGGGVLALFEGEGGGEDGCVGVGRRMG